MAETVNQPIVATTSPSTGPSANTFQSGSSRNRDRNAPYGSPTPDAPWSRTTLLILAIYPTTLILGYIFSLGHPETYFSHSSNLFNKLFVKFGWFWSSLVFAIHLVQLPDTQRVKAAGRWMMATLCWVLVTQWCFGAPLTDKTMIWTGGVCEVAQTLVHHVSDLDGLGSMDLGSRGMTGVQAVSGIVSDAACKRVQGRWRGGHDLSGHVFMLTHASLSLITESVLVPSSLAAAVDRRPVLVLVGGWWWMLLMTAAYFHTWREKVTGLIVGLGSWALVYRVPVLRRLFGLPGY